MQWLLIDFLGYINEWEREIASTPGLTKKEKQKLGLNRETVQGMKITGTIKATMIIHVLYTNIYMH